MAVKLDIWNKALFELGDYRLSDTGERVESARILTAVWDDVVADCLEDGAWNFAMRSVKLASDTGISPNFGPTEIFAKPSDWIRTWAVAHDDRYQNPVLDYVDEQEYWAAESSPLYFRFTSNDTGAGMDIGNWPSAFTRFVEKQLAFTALPRLNQDKGTKERLMRDTRVAKRNALNKDTMNEAQPKFTPTSSWTNARGRGARRRDRGNTGSLLG